jgi:hypothetical protein
MAGKIRVQLSIEAPGELEAPADIFSGAQTEHRGA